MSRYPGRILSSTAPTVNANTAKGIWTLDEALRYSRAGQWPVPTGNGDPYFQYNTMLLPGQGTTGMQNHSFLDSSTNNFTITRNGNTTQGTFTPFSGTAGNWSNYFDGTGDYLTLPDSTALNLETGDFTIELWFYVTTSGVNNPLIYRFDGDASSRNELQFGIVYNSSGNLVFSAFQSTTNDDIPFTGVSINQWHHCALVRSGNNIYAYLDGVRNPTTRTLVGSLNSGGFPTWIGGYREGGAFQYLNGFISNLRILKGTALYTGSTYTVPTAPLTAITNTTLLTCQNNRFVDNSTNAFTLTANGNVAVTPFQPFGAPTTAYSASTIGGSGYFDGSGDNLVVQTNSANSVGSGSFYFEAWVYLTNPSAQQMIVADPSNTGGLFVGLNVDGSNRFAIGRTAVAVDNFVTVTWAGNQWYHLAVNRNGTSLQFFVNGTQVGSTGTNSVNYPSVGYRVGAEQSAGSSPLTGYISGLRLVKSSVNTSNFAIPTAPPDASSSALCLQFTNAGIIDNAQDNNLETVGGAQISTTQYKWGASSMYFDGTGDYLIGPSNPILAFGTGDFTIECWVYVNSNKNQGIFDTRNAAMSTTGIAFALNSSGNPYVFVNNANLFVSSSVVPLLTWTHLACVKTAGVISVYMNGNKVGSAASATNLTDKTPTIAGVIDYRDTSSTYKFDGYINNLRVTTGYSRYPYNFTAPTAAFPLFYQAAATPSADPYFENTTLLLPGNGTNGAQNNTFLDSSTNAFTITRNGNTTQGTFTPFSQTGWSNYFDGTSGQYLNTVANSAFSFGTSDFTVEGWVYPTGTNTGAPMPIVEIRTNSTNTSGFSFVRVANSLKLNVYSNGYLGESTNSLALNYWNHVALTRSGSTWTYWINGISSGSFTNSSNQTDGGTTGPKIGGSSTAGEVWIGYLSNIRVTKGAALYTSNFIPSTTPLTTTVSSGTVSLLTCQSNRFVDSSANAFAITVNGSPSVQAFSPFNPTAAYSTSTVGGSGYFDGSGDYLTVPYSSQLQFTGDFTIEFWAYPLTQVSAFGGVVNNYSSWPSSTGFAIFCGHSSASSTKWCVALFSTFPAITSTNDYIKNAWSHIALVRSGTGSNNITLYVNGVASGTATSNNTVTGTADNWWIGATGDGTTTQNFTGYLSNFRAINSAVYTSAFTPPTAPLVAGSSKLLLSYTNGGIIDNTAKNNLETVGGASISTTVSKFGGSSMYFDGSGDALYIPDSPNLKFGTGDFTMEAWVYLTATPSAQFATIIGRAEYGSTGDWIFQVTNALKLTIYINTGYTATSTGAISLNTWTHVAAVRYGSSVRLFINGVQDGSGTSSASTENNATGVYTVGSDQAADEAMFTGYINDLRLTKGIARYTTNFTPPTSAFLTL